MTTMSGDTRCPEIRNIQEVDCVVVDVAFIFSCPLARSFYTIPSLTVLLFIVGSLGKELETPKLAAQIWHWDSIVSTPKSSTISFNLIYFLVARLTLVFFTQFFCGIPPCWVRPSVNASVWWM